MNLVAETPALNTFVEVTSKGETARLPSARFRSSKGKPASRSAPRTMSPEIPEKQSKYKIRDIVEAIRQILPISLKLQ
jgi:hypothetical protein